MHSNKKLFLIVGWGVLGWVGGAGPASAQSPPWDLFIDSFSDESCDLVNAGNAELVVFSTTGELIVITGADAFVEGSFVDVDGTVLLDGLPFGIIDFATDGDGSRSLWWLTLTGTVVDIDPFTLSPSDSGLLPTDFSGVPCDACLFWDDPADCNGDAIIDLDFDGVPDAFDLCPDTPFDEPVDFDGCACFEVDADLDGVDDCDDLCPETPPFDDVDFDGCACFEVDSDGDGIDDCDDLCPDSPFDEGVDADGCACSELIDCLCEADSDRDGVSDCDDECPATPRNTSVDFDGCPAVVVVQPPPITIACGNFGITAMALMFCGLFFMRSGRTRQYNGGNQQEARK